MDILCAAGASSATTDRLVNLVDCPATQQVVNATDTVVQNDHGLYAISYMWKRRMPSW